jgi:uncharacterized repeat protein (TIGR01451 family)
MQHKHRPRWIGLPLILVVLVVAASFAIPFPVSAQSPLPIEENFAYGGADGTLVAVSDGLWTAYAGTSGFVRYDADTSLSLDGYPSSAIGGSATISRLGEQDVVRRFIRPASGDMYVAALINISWAGSGYFFHLTDSAAVNWPARVWARDSEGTFNFGFSNANLVKWSNQDFSYNTTYLLVIKYSLNSGASALYVLSSPVPGEPATPLLSDTGTPIAVEGVVIRQNAFSPITPDAILDGMRIAASWAEAVGAPIHVTKWAPAVVAPAQTFTYTITTTNKTELDLTGLIIYDTVPTNATFLSASDGGAVHAGMVEWTVAEPLVPGASVVRTFQVRASNTAGVFIVNDEYGASAVNCPTPGVGSPVTTEVRLPPPPDILVIKSGPSLATPGETLVYTLEVNNSSVTAAEGVVLGDTLPPGVTYVGDDIGTPSNPSPGVYTWNLGTLAGGAENTYHLTVTVSDALAYGSVLTNQAVVSTTSDETDLTDNSDQCTTTVLELITVAEARQRVGQTVMTEGTVTAEPGIFVDSNVNRKLYMEDSTAGILVYRSTGLNPVARSNKVRVAGQVMVMSGETLIAPTTAANVLDLGPATPVTPAQVATGSVNESVEGELIQVYGRIVSKPYPYILNVDDGSGVVTINRYSNLGNPGDPNYIDTSLYNVGDHLQVAGVSVGVESDTSVTRTILPRGPADLKEYFVVTFQYHDLEDVVHLGEEVTVAGSFNAWDPYATPLTADAGYSVFATTVTLETGGLTTYQYVVHSGGEQWPLWLNTLVRSVNLQGSPTLAGYRNVDVEYAQLLGPEAITANLGEGPIVEGQVGIPSVTDPEGEGRAVHAEVGYGTGTSPGKWSWAAMGYADLQAGTYDIYTGTLLPAASGVYSFAVRFDGNWGLGNPNAGWTYGDLDGTGLGDAFELSETGVITLTAPILSIAKDVLPVADVVPGGTVTYTIALSNTGDGLATGVALVDILPAEVTFGGWLQQSGATEISGTVEWAGDLEVLSTVTIAFTATVSPDPYLTGETIINTASYVSGNGGSGADDATFAMVPWKTIYLPLIMRGSAP